MTKERTTISHSRLKELLHYNPETGVWTWLRATSARKPAGSEAGDVKPSGYRLIGVDGVRYRAHRLAWFYVTETWPDSLIDHIDGIRSNNAFSNLRLANCQQNAANSKISKNNTSGYKGVYWLKQRSLWAAKVNVGPKQIYLGSFQKAEDAARAYEQGAKRYFGEFARVA